MGQLFQFLYFFETQHQMENNKYQMYSLKSEQVKYSAFFQYLKSFSSEGTDILQKLENQFSRKIRKKMQNYQTLSTIKNLLTSYEIFILQIKDSCDFVQISEFGQCIGRTFIQLLKIIKWFLKTWLKNKKQPIEGQSELSGKNEDNTCSFCKELIKTSLKGRQGKGKRYGLTNTFGNDMREVKLTFKQQIAHLLNMKENILERTQKQIASRHIIDLGEMDILNQKHIAMKLETSNNEMVLEQVLNELNNKTEAINRFVTNTQASCIQNFKMNEESRYLVFEEEMRQIITNKYSEAKEKLKQLMLLKISEHQKSRKNRLVDMQTQTDSKVYLEKESYQSKLNLLTAQCKKLANQLQSEKIMTQKMRQLLENKSIQFQAQFLNFRKQVIQESMRSKHYLKSLKSFKELNQQNSKGEMEENDSESIYIEPIVNPIKNKFEHRNLMKKDKPVKNRYSIKFTLSEVQVDPVNQSFPTVKFYNLTNHAETQTQFEFAKSIQAESSTTPSAERMQKTSNLKSKSAIKFQRKRKVASESSYKIQPSSQIYSHIKSKVKTKNKQVAVDPISALSQKTRSNCISIVNKLPLDQLFPKKQQNPPLEAQLFKICEPTFIQVSQYSIRKDDIQNLFLNSGNASNYESLIYRNSFFNLSNIYKKRAINFLKQIEQKEIESIGKKLPQGNEATESKIFQAFHHQLKVFKKTNTHIYEQLKRLLRSPYEISKNIQIIHLNSNKDGEKDIEITELKRMVSIIFKLHSNCLGQQKNSICEHIYHFFLGIGIKFI